MGRAASFGLGALAALALCAAIAVPMLRFGFAIGTSVCGVVLEKGRVAPGITA
jgi:hypothetical protein